MHITRALARNGHFSRTTWVSRYQKGKPVWPEMIEFLGTAGPYANLAPVIFYRLGALPDTQPTVSKQYLK